MIAGAPFSQLRRMEKSQAAPKADLIRKISSGFQ